MSAVIAPSLRDLLQEKYRCESKLQQMSKAGYSGDSPSFSRKAVRVLHDKIAELDAEILVAKSLYQAQQQAHLA